MCIPKMKIYLSNKVLCPEVQILTLSWQKMLALQGLHLHGKQALLAKLDLPVKTLYLKHKWLNN